MDRCYYYRYGSGSRLGGTSRRALPGHCARICRRRAVCCCCGWYSSWESCRTSGRLLCLLCYCQIFQQRTRSDPDAVRPSGEPGLLEARPVRGGAIVVVVEKLEQRKELLVCQLLGPGPSLVRVTDVAFAPLRLSLAKFSIRYTPICASSNCFVAWSKCDGQTIFPARQHVMCSFLVVRTRYRCVPCIAPAVLPVLPKTHRTPWTEKEKKGKT